MTKKHQHYRRGEAEVTMDTDWKKRMMPFRGAKSETRFITVPIFLVLMQP